jgi:hypothetical protein
MSEFMSPPQEDEETIVELRPHFRTRQAEEGELRQTEEGEKIRWFAWCPESVNGSENISGHGVTELDALTDLENRIRKILKKG